MVQGCLSRVYTFILSLQDVQLVYYHQKYTHPSGNIHVYQYEKLWSLFYVKAFNTLFEHLCKLNLIAFAYLGFPMQICISFICLYIP